MDEPSIMLCFRGVDSGVRPMLSRGVLGSCSGAYYGHITVGNSWALVLQRNVQPARKHAFGVNT